MEEIHEYKLTLTVLSPDTTAEVLSEIERLLKDNEIAFEWVSSVKVR